MRVAAQSRSASEVQSAQTTAAALPPSSSVTCLSRHGVRICAPTGPEPVNETTGSRGSATSAPAPVVRHGSTENMPGGQVGLGQQLAEQQRGQRGRRRRLEHDRGADRDRRGDLVRDQVEREVERRDAQHRPARHAADQRDPAGRGRVGVEPLQLAGEAPGLLGRPPERRHRAADLGARPLQRLAVLGGDQLGDLVGPLGEPAGDVVEGRRPRVRGQRARPARPPRPPPRSARSTCSGVANVVRPTGAAVVRVVDGDHRVAGLGPTGDVERGRSRPEA